MSQKSPKNLDWPVVTFFFLTTLAAVLGPIFYFFFFGWSWLCLAFVLVFGGLTGMSITGGYHRLFSHRSYEASLWVKSFYLLFGAAAFQGSALQWCTDHRVHHKFVDTERDPYNIKAGFWYAHVGWLFLRNHSRYQNPFPADLQNDSWVLFQHRYYVPIAIFMCFGFPTLIGLALGNAWMGFLFGGVVRLVLTHHGTFFINSLCHMFGTQPYSDRHTARDNGLLAVLTYGEGYHNYHHEFQFDYRNGIRWYQWDPTKWWIQVLTWLGSARRLKRVPEAAILKARLQMRRRRLESRGLGSERLGSLTQRVEEAYQRAEQLRAEYRRLKELARSRGEAFRLKAELKIARLEFKKTYAQWKIYSRTLETLAA